MPDGEMTLGERFKFLRIMQKGYLEAGREDRGRLLDEWRPSPVWTYTRTRDLLRSIKMNALIQRLAFQPHA
jgi:hypothetical protein